LVYRWPNVIRTAEFYSGAAPNQRWAIVAAS